MYVAAFWLVIALVQSARDVDSVPAPTRKMLVIGDGVEVRLEPEPDADLLGMVFKNMIVDVSRRTPAPKTVGEHVDYWYKIRHDAVEGWCFGIYLSPDVPRRPVDTYDAPGDDTWFLSRFGELADPNSNARRFNPDTFILSASQTEQMTLDDYRGLIKLANSNGRYAGDAWLVLAGSLFKNMKTKPDDPALSYFGPKVSSRSFWVNGLVRNLRPGRENQLLMVVPTDLANDPNFYRELLYRGVHVELLYAWFPDLLKSNTALAREALHAKASLIGSLPGPLLANKDRLIDLLRNARPSPFRFLPVPFNEDLDFCRKLLKVRNQYAVDYPALSPALQGDTEIALTALAESESSIDSVPVELWQEKDFVHRAIKVAKYHAVWEKVQSSWLADPTFKHDLAAEILSELPRDVSAVMWIPDSLLADQNFIYLVRKRLRENFPSQYCRDKSLSRLKGALATRQILSAQEVAHLLAYPCPQ